MYLQHRVSIYPTSTVSVPVKAVRPVVAKYTVSVRAKAVRSVVDTSTVSLRAKAVRPVVDTSTVSVRAKAVRNHGRRVRADDDPDAPSV